MAVVPHLEAQIRSLAEPEFHRGLAGHQPLICSAWSLSDSLAILHRILGEHYPMT